MTTVRFCDLNVGDVFILTGSEYTVVQKLRDKTIVRRVYELYMGNSIEMGRRGQYKVELVSKINNLKQAI